jgi:hypothetical protein
MSKKVAIGFDDGTIRLQWQLWQATLACYARCLAQGMNDTEFAEYHLGRMHEILREFVPASKHHELERALRNGVRALRAHGFAVRWPPPKAGESRCSQHER